MCPLAVPAESEGVGGWGSDERRSCAVLSLLKSSLQFVTIMRPHNNPGIC